MNYKDLSDSIDKGLNAMSNYQFVVICHLVKQRGLKDNKKNICEVLQASNKADKRDSKHYMNCPVWRVLTKKGVITYDKSNMEVKLNVELTNEQREKLSLKCKGNI